MWDVRGNTSQPIGRLTGTSSSIAGSEPIIYCVSFTNSNSATTSGEHQQPLSAGLPTTGVTGRAASLFNVPSSLVASINSGVTSSNTFFHVSTSSNAMMMDTSRTKPEQIRSIYETGTSETCNSLAWHPHNQNLLLTGVNGKTLKILDIRCLLFALILSIFSSSPF